VDANCEGANFKLADLRKADLTDAILVKTKFEDAKVFGCILTSAKLGDNPDYWVDDSEAGDGSQKIPVRQWLARMSVAN
jgi:hypothetical protein